MARARNRTSGGNKKKESSTTATATTTTNKKESNTMSELSVEQINDILAGTRSRGAGTEYLSDFLERAIVGEEVNLTSGPLAGKDPVAAFTTLSNAKKRTKTNPDGTVVQANPEFGKVQIRKRNFGSRETPDWHVYVINTELYSAEAGE